MRRAHAPVPCVHAGEGETRGGERQSRRRTSDQRWAGRGASTTIERATSSPQQGSKACCHVRSKSQRSVCTGRNLTRLAAFFVDSGAGRSIDARTWDGGQWWVGGRAVGRRCRWLRRRRRRWRAVEGRRRSAAAAAVAVAGDGRIRQAVSMLTTIRDERRWVRRAVGRRERAWDGRWRATAGETVTEALSSAGGSDGRRRRERCDLRGSDAHTPLSYLGQDRLWVWLF